MLKHLTLLVLILPLLILFAGCGGEKMGYVTGTVTLNGEPFHGAFIRFTPQHAGSSYSSGCFDTNGTYELRFSLSKKGVQLGPAIVTFVFPPPDNENPMPEYVKKHKKFIESFEEEVIVKSGKQTFNFDLKTE